MIYLWRVGVPRWPGTVLGCAALLPLAGCDGDYAPAAPTQAAAPTVVVPAPDPVRAESPSAAPEVLAALEDVRGRLDGLDKPAAEAVAALGAAGRPAEEVRGRLDALERQTAEVAELLRAATRPVLDDAEAADDGTGGLDLDTLQDVGRLVLALPKDATLQQRTALLRELQQLVVAPADDVKFQETIRKQSDELRGLVVAGFERHRDAAHKLIDTPTRDAGRKADEQVRLADEVLGAYPDPTSVAAQREFELLAEARNELATRVGKARLTRYNLWALGQVRAAHKAYDDATGALGDDEDALVEKVAEPLSGVDPSLLEPAVLSVYTSVLERAKGQLGEQQQLDMVQRVTNAQRETLADH